MTSHSFTQRIVFKYLLCASPDCYDSIMYKAFHLVPNVFFYSGLYTWHVTKHKNQFKLNLEYTDEQV